MNFAPVRVGVIGLGDISRVYLNGITRSPAFELVGVGARRDERAQEVAAKLGVRAMTVDALLADRSIEVVVDLTPGIEHERLNERVIAAGKHLYTEKPFALSRAAAERLAELASRGGTLIGGAPDTFYGAAHQAARAALDAGRIGRPVFGRSFIGLPGLELFHPNPAQFYRPGGEPPYDFGPYYFTQWIHLLGPVRQVYASGGRGKDVRTVLRGPQAGASFPVDVSTTFNIVLEFDAASVAATISLDVAVPTVAPGELFGADGILQLADPLFFSGSPALVTAGGGRAELATDGRPFSVANRRDHVGHPVADYRGTGLVDLAIAIRTGMPHRTGPDFLVHVSEVMEAIVRSARERVAVTLTSSCVRPRPVDPAADELLVRLTASPFDPPN